jgi:hypothetical protein
MAQRFNAVTAPSRRRYGFEGRGADTLRGAPPAEVRRPFTLVHKRQNPLMASYVVNERALARAQRLIRARQYVLNSDWGDVQPNAQDENAFLASHAWGEYGEWHLGLTEGVADETKARYAFVYGDFRRLHRTGLIACHYRAAERRHKEIELAAHDLLQLLDKASA